MAYERPSFTPRETLRSRRQQQRARQQANCCGCVLILLALGVGIWAWRGPLRSWRQPRERAIAAAAGFPLTLATDAATYLRFQLVRVQAVFTDAQGRRQMAPKPLQFIVLRQGQPVRTIGDFTTIEMRYNRNLQAYVAYWPIPWNCPLGEYIAEARVMLPDPSAWSWDTEETLQERRRQRRKEPVAAKPEGVGVCLARARFYVTGRPPRADIPKGLGVATWEPDFQEQGIRRPDGRIGDWRAIFDWCDYIGADTFCFRGAVTEAYEQELTLQQPFNPANIAAVPLLAAEAHRRGLRFGTWASAYSTYPKASNAGKPRYQYAQDISLSSGMIFSRDFISLFDRRRIDHLAGFLAQAQADPNVDYVGLDYMRTDRGGYEMTDRFVQEMPLRLPKDFSRWSRTRRWAYVARKIEREWQSDPRFYEAWNWWRAHLGAEIVRDIIAKGQLKKPLWIFVLSWQHGMQHGQDPLMFTDAGVGFLAPMLYQVPNRAHFDQLVREWNAYVAAGQVNLCPGDQVDFYWHQKTLRPAAPEELYDRIITAHGHKGQGLLRGGLTLGGFVHDIGRIQRPHPTWPHPGTEWALAGGAALSTIRMNWRVFPLVAKLEMPASAPLNTIAEGQLTIENIARKEVRQITLNLEKTEGIELAGPLESISLRPGDTLIKKVRVRLKGGHSDRANRFMVCIRLRWPPGDYGPEMRSDLKPMLLVMDYIQGR